MPKYFHYYYLLFCLTGLFFRGLLQVKSGRPKVSKIRTYRDRDYTTSIFQDYPGKPVPECLHSVF